MEDPSYTENIIIGAGPAGIQQAYFLKKTKKDYLVLEKTSVASFFKQFPIQRQLISVNKVFCGDNQLESLDSSENVLRYDWNSLLLEADDIGKLHFRNFSEDYYPKADCLVDYLEEFCRTFQIRIRNAVEIISITKDEGFYVLRSREHLYKCTHLFIACGLKPKRMQFKVVPPPSKHFFYYDEVPSEPNVFKNKNILIIGGGNAAFEVANYVNDVCNELRLIGAEKFAWRTHYPGYIRSVNMKILDSYYLKLKVNLDWTNNKSMRTDEKYRTELHKLQTGEVFHDTDIVIYCGGFEPAIPKWITGIDVQTCSNGFPLLTPFFESISAKNMFFIGALSQQHDYKRGTSAFIHGFRYNIKILTKFLTSTFDIQYFNNTKDTVNAVMKQINTSSCLLHRFDYIGDYIFFEKGRHCLIKHIPLSCLKSEHQDGIETIMAKTATESKICVQSYLGYDPRNKFSASFTQPQTGNPAMKDESVFIHPIFDIYLKDVVWDLLYTFHLPENAYNKFSGREYHYSLLYNLFELIHDTTTYPHICKDHMKNKLRSFDAMIHLVFQPYKGNGESGIISEL